MIKPVLSLFLLVCYQILNYDVLCLYTVILIRMPISTIRNMVVILIILLGVILYQISTQKSFQNIFQNVTPSQNFTASLLYVWASDLGFRLQLRH